MTESLKPGDVCPTCTRKIPKERADEPAQRKIFSVAAPKGEDPQHTIVEPLEVLHGRFRESGAQALPDIGAMTGWKYYTLALGLALLLQSGLVPSEEGS